MSTAQAKPLWQFSRQNLSEQTKNQQFIFRGFFFEADMILTRQFQPNKDSMKVIQNQVYQFKKKQNDSRLL